MQKLSQIVDALGEQIHQKLDPAACKLLHNKKELDMSLPVRFANIPPGSTLELHSGGSCFCSTYAAKRAYYHDVSSLMR